MATKPSEDFLWAESETDPTRVTDPTALRPNGFPFKSAFASNAANYLFRALGRWTDFLQALFDTNGNLTFDSGNGIVQVDTDDASNFDVSVQHTGAGASKLSADELDAPTVTATDVNTTNVTATDVSTTDLDAVTAVLAVIDSVRVPRAVGIVTSTSSTAAIASQLYGISSVTFVSDSADTRIVDVNLGTAIDVGTPLVVNATVEGSTTPAVVVNAFDNSSGTSAVVRLVMKTVDGSAIASLTVDVNLSPYYATP